MVTERLDFYLDQAHFLSSALLVSSYRYQLMWVRHILASRLTQALNMLNTLQMLHMHVLKYEIVKDFCIQQIIVGVKPELLCCWAFAVVKIVLSVGHLAQALTGPCSLLPSFSLPAYVKSCFKSVHCIPQPRSTFPPHFALWKLFLPSLALHHSSNQLFVFETPTPPLHPLLVLHSCALWWVRSVA